MVGLFNIKIKIYTISSISEENTTYSEEISANIEHLNKPFKDFTKTCKDSITLSGNIKENINSFKLK